MNKALSTKNYVLVLSDRSKFFLNKEEAELVKEAIRNDVKYIEIGESIVMTFSISRLVTGAEYEEVERVKRGEWKCRYNEWHERNQECGHMLQ